MTVHLPGPHPAPDQPPQEETRLEEERALDRAALAQALPGEGVRPATPEDAVTAAPAPSRSGLGLRRRTWALLAVIVGGLCFLGGIQVQKLAGGAPASPVEAPPTAGGQAPVPAEPADVLVAGEILAIRGSTLYVREPGGRTVTVHATPGARVARGAPVDLGSVRPGETVVASSHRAADGRLAATSLTVVPAPDRRAGRR